MLEVGTKSEEKDDKKNNTVRDLRLFSMAKINFLTSQTFVVGHLIINTENAILKQWLKSPKIITGHNARVSISMITLHMLHVLSYYTCFTT